MSDATSTASSPFSALTLPLLVMLGIGFIFSAMAVIESSRNTERAQLLLRDLDRAQVFAQQAVNSDSEFARQAAGSLRSALDAIQRNPSRSLLEADTWIATHNAGMDVLVALERAQAAPDPAGADRRDTFVRLLAAQRATAQQTADAISHRSERNARWMLVLASLMVALCVAVLVISRVSLRREADERRRAEADTAISHSELNASIEKLTEVSLGMQRLSAYASLLQSCQNIEEALDITRISLSVVMPGYGGSVYLLRPLEPDEEGVEHAELAISWGTHPAPSADRFTASECWAMRRGRPFSSNPRTADLHCAHVHAGSRTTIDTPELGSDAINAAEPTDAATLCLPLAAQGESIGLLYLSGPDPLRGDDLAVTAAEQLSMALANLRMKETLHNQSIRDTLTGLFNRRYLEETLLREQSRSNRQQRPLAVMMLDVDHFKRFNDTHGHPGGDALLTALGKLLRQISRAEDTPCRYGGEEFTVIMPETDADAARAQAERIRSAVAAMAVRHGDGTLSPVTASIGVAVYPAAANSTDALVEAADAALYRAKTEGRDRVCLAEPLSSADRPSAAAAV